MVKSLDLPLLKDKPDESFELVIKVRLHKAANFVSQIQLLNCLKFMIKYEDIAEYKKLSAFDTGLLINTDAMRRHMYSSVSGMQITEQTSSTQSQY